MITPFLINRLRCTTVILPLIAITACTTVGPTYVPVTPGIAPAVINAPQWNAPLPHGGDVVTLKDWWASWNDAALLALIDATQSNSATLDAAAARIAQARAGAQIAGAGGAPMADANSALSRGNLGGLTSTAWANALQAAWEIDLFGGAARGREAAQARIGASEIAWHDARVSLAADVATVYANLRVNQLLTAGFEADTASRRDTARLTQLKTNAGFEAPANAALAQASAAEAQTRIDSQQTEVDLGVKALVSLSGLAESRVRGLVQVLLNPLPKPAQISLEKIPAAALAQRPDLAAIERQLGELSAQIGVAEADRYPKITLTGSIGYSVARALGQTSDGATWGFGPAISLPLFDAGRRAANVDLSRARYAETIANYKGAATRAVQEVEEALTRLQSTRTREPNVQRGLDGYIAFERAAQARLNAGLGSLLELQEARRAVLGGQVALLNLQRERLVAWIALYRAAGGDWTTNTSLSQVKK